MRVKLRVYLLITVVLILIISIIVALCFLKTDKVTSKSRKYLTQVLGYNFENANIEKIYNNDSEKCVVVILNDNLKKFKKDSFVEEEFFLKDSQGKSFDSLKKLFPDVFDMSFSEIECIYEARKSYVVNDWIVGYSVFWFSANFDGKEKIVIYAFLPQNVT